MYISPHLIVFVEKLIKKLTLWLGVLRAFFFWGSIPAGGIGGAGGGAGTWGDEVS